MSFAPTTAVEISGPMPETLIRRQCLRRFQGEGVPLERQKRRRPELVRYRQKRHQLAEPDINRVASVWHTDADVGRRVDVVTDMSKGRRLCFPGYTMQSEPILRRFWD
jgi:hypothetical protein